MWNRLRRHRHQMSCGARGNFFLTLAIIILFVTGATLSALADGGAGGNAGGGSGGIGFTGNAGGNASVPLRK